MEIKECRSSNFILGAIKQKVIEMADKFRSYYKNELSYHCYIYSRHIIYVSENIVHETTIFGKVVYKNIEHRDILTIRLNDRNLEITIIDPIIYSIVKEEFTKFAEDYKDDIKSICFLKDF